MNNLIAVINFCVGASIGSFINLIRYRIPKKESIFFPASYCDKCKKPLSFFQKVPIVSSLSISNECKFCGYRPHFEYGFIEIFSGLLFVLNIYEYKFSFSQFTLADYIFTCFFMTTLILISLIDIDTLKIPNKIILYFYTIGILMILFSSVDFFSNLSVLVYRLGFSFLIFFSIEIFSILYFSFRKKIPIGTGDTKLISTLTIWFGPIGAIISLVSSIYLAAGYIFYSFIRKKNIKPKFAFAPFLSLGALLYLILGLKLNSIIFLNR